MSDLYHALKESIKTANWSAFSSAYAQDHVYLIDNHLDLVETCMDMTESEDNVTMINQYIQDGLIYPPLPEEANAWQKDSEQLFDYLVIGDYYLVQLKGNL